MNARQTRAWVRLSLCHSVGSRTWNQWLVELDVAGVALDAFFDLPEHEARPLIARWPSIAHALRHDAPTAHQVDKTQARMERESVRLLPINDLLYPARLLTDLGFDAPPFLYAVGSLNHLRGPTLAMVGTRTPSPQGVESSRAYAQALAGKSVHVVSGHARGIDVAAHEGAVGAGGSTTLVLPCGVFAFDLAPSLRERQNENNILILSQFHPEAAVTTELPVFRNTTIASLGDGLLVVECRLTGGSAYAFREARRLRKPLWAVIFPQPVPPSATGNHSLLFAGALRLEPGREGAERCVEAMAQRLHEARAEHPASGKWPPREGPGQEELF